MWEPGDIVILRYFTYGLPDGALPTRVAATEPATALWLAPGTTTAWAGIGGRHVREAPLVERYTEPRAPIEHVWRGDGVLILEAPGRPYSIYHFRENDRFAGWYVNLEAVWQRFALGFDTEDHVLDIWVER